MNNSYNVWSQIAPQRSGRQILKERDHFVFYFLTHPPHPAIQRGGRPAKLPTLLNNIFSFQLWQQYLLFFLHSYPM